MQQTQLCGWQIRKQHGRAKQRSLGTRREISGDQNFHLAMHYAVNRPSRQSDEGGPASLGSGSLSAPGCCYFAR